MKIEKTLSIRKAVEILDSKDIDTVIVEDKGIVIGLFTMGDFRRSVLSGLDINDKIENIIKKDFISIKESEDVDIVKLFNINPNVNDIPILNDSKKLVDILKRNKYAPKSNKIENINVVIMAGGKGTRLDPFTRVLPKPLIPIGNKSIVEIIMDEFKHYGIENFYLSVNEKSKMIKAYFSDQNLRYKINYLNETKPLGTVGALSQISKVVENDLIVSNCDILIKSCYSTMIEFHRNEKHDITIVGSMQHHRIPYGVCMFDSNGGFDFIDEKPEHSYLVSTGMYIINKKVLSLIPMNSYFDMPDLISLAKANGLKIGVHPVSEKSWLDIGQWEDYSKTLKSLNL